MELKIVREGVWRPAVLGGGVGGAGLGGNVQEDILVLGGRDTEIGWEDVFAGMYIHVCSLRRERFANEWWVQVMKLGNRLVSTVRWSRG